jgi:hypothetical protein
MLDTNTRTAMNRCRLFAVSLIAVAGAAFGSTESGNNNFFGTGAGNFSLTGCCNAAFGANAGNGLTTGHRNIFFGTGAGQSVADGAHNAFLGVDAGHFTTTGSDNVQIGFETGLSNNGSGDTFVGMEAGHTNTSGSYSTFLGYQAGYANTQGGFNVFIGELAGSANTTASNNVIVGANAGRSNTINGANVFVGIESGYSDTEAFNTFLGAYSGRGNTTGFYNTYVGSNAAQFATTGAGNTALGAGAGGTTVTGQQSTFLGYNAKGEPSASNATAVGSEAYVGQSNSLVLGSIAGINGAATSVKVGIGTATPARLLHLKGDSAGTNSANTTAVRVENTSSTTGVRRLLDLVNNGNSQITFTDTSVAGQYWGLQNQADFFLLQRNGNVPLKVSDTGQIYARDGAAPYHFVLNSNGNLTISGVLTQGSDVNSKKDIVMLDGATVLARLDALPVAEWSYKSEDVRHAGPMAQDFHAAFGYGDDDTRLAPGDEAGVALAAVKALNAKVDALQARNDALSAQVAALRERLERATPATTLASAP